MRPDHEDEELPPVKPYVWTLVGRPRSHSAYEVNLDFDLLIKFECLSGFNFI